MGDARMTGSARAAVSLLVAGGLVLAGATGAAAVDSSPDLDEKAPSWDVAAARLGTAGSLWEPTDTGKLERKRRVAVVADNLAFANGAVTAGDTLAITRYRKGDRILMVTEKWANTGWAAEPDYDPSMARVGTVKVKLGDPGTQITVRAVVFANCYPQPDEADPRPAPKRYRCEKSDVKKTGGVLIMTARPPSQMTAPGTTSIVMQSNGLTYKELVAAARSLEQVAGSVSDGAGSAQMVGMCRQMVSGGMTFDQAKAFAESNGYLARVGSIDGEPQAVTADYRPDRFTVDIVSDAVTACQYG
jgi:hypothetical protein